MRGELEEADRVVAESSDAKIFQSTAQGQAWRLTARVMVAAIRGCVEADDIRQLMEVVDANLTRADRLLCLGTAASGYLRRGDMSNALAVAERGLDELRETGIIWGNYVYGVAGVIEVFLAGWAMGGDSPALGADARAKAILACKYARRAARTSPVCQPQLLLLRGRVAFLSGRRRRARRMWAKAASTAEKLDAPGARPGALRDRPRVPVERSRSQFMSFARRDDLRGDRCRRRFCGGAASSGVLIT